MQEQNAELAQREYERQLERVDLGSATQTDIERATTNRNNARLAARIAAAL